MTKAHQNSKGFRKPRTFPGRSNRIWVEAELRGVLDSISSGVLLLDRYGRVRYLNGKLIELLGLVPRQPESVARIDDLQAAIGARVRDPQSLADRWHSAVASGKGPIRDELEVIHPVHRLLERRSRPVFDSAKRRIGWLEVYRDITAERTITSKLLQTEKMAALGQLVSGIAHELNNPLTGVLGYAELLLRQGLAAEQENEARKIYQEAERARRIVKNLLFFAREKKPERTEIDLNELIERTVALRSYELKVENIVVSTALNANLPRTMADPFQLQQVILNLLVNAEQALLEGKGQGHIHIQTLQPTPDRIAMEVADDGPGIPQEIAPRVFDPFFTTKPPGVGTGLGLSIVYGIVHEHGGEVALESRPGAGVRFTIELPLLQAQSHAVASELSVEPLKKNPGAPSRILVVEDEQTIAQLVRDVLREDGHQVDTTLESHEALRLLARNEYDLVICDLRMPRLDGEAFYQSLVRIGNPIRHRIIFTTGDTLGPRTLTFLESTGLPYLAKPFLVEELKLAVSRMLEGAGALGPRAENDSANLRLAKRRSSG
jgi:signal transduction histidine kinase/FixJ family two-component response regulator